MVDYKDTQSFQALMGTYWTKWCNDGAMPGIIAGLALAAHRRVIVCDQVADTFLIQVAEPFIRHDCQPVLIKNSGATLEYGSYVPYLADKLKDPTKIYFRNKDYTCDTGLLGFHEAVPDGYLYGPVYSPNNQLT
jgi:hypothetical protein